MTHQPFTHALVRVVSRALERCELLHVTRQRFDLTLARQQHHAYVNALESAGVAVAVLPEVPDLPDSAFVEDPVVILDEHAVVGRAGCASREAEAELMAREVARVRPLSVITAPGTLEGGDVLRIGRTLFVGESSRTNRAGIEQLERIVAPFGYGVTAVSIRECLHLKTAVTSPGDGLILANPDWVDLAPFERAGLEILRVPLHEPWGANTLPVNGRVFVAASAPQTGDLLVSRGLHVQLIEVAELQKAEAGLTCLSVLYGVR